MDRIGDITLSEGYSWTLAELRAFATIRGCNVCGEESASVIQSPDCRRILPGTLRYSLASSFVVRR